MTNHAAPDPPTNAPYIPSEVEAKNYFYGLPSKPRLIARSSADVWIEPTGPETYLEPKELIPLGTHRLNEVWEDTVGPAIDNYLVEKQNDIDDIHVIIYESKFTRLATMYKPDFSMKPPLYEPFSTTLGIPICDAKTPNIEGTGGFFFVDTAKPGILYLLTARHVLFHPGKEENTLYEFREGSDQPKRKVLLMGEAAFKAHCEAMEFAISDKQIDIKYFKRRLMAADEMEGEEDANAELKAVKSKMKVMEGTMAAFRKVLADVTRDWTDEEKRVLGHVTLSPPISVDDNDGFTDDWAVIQICPSMIDNLNFIGNAIDLGSVDIEKLATWVHICSTNLVSFEYPDDNFLRFCGTVSDQEMFSPEPRTKDHDNDTVIMVLKNGNASNFTVGLLNTIRTFVREYFKGKPGRISKEVGVFSHKPKPGSFSEPGDSGSVVVDVTGRVCGIITGGDGASDVSDCTFITSVNFLIKRLAAFGIDANIFPLPADL